MRRFAALFKRNDKDAPAASSTTDARADPPSKSSSVKRLFRNLSAKTIQPAVVRNPQPPVPRLPLQAYSSSSSSTDSPAPTTPDDDSESGPSVAGRRSNQWSDRKLAPPLPVVNGSLRWDPRKLSLGLPSIQTIAKSDDSEDSDDGSSTTSSSPSISPPPPVSSRISPHISLHSLTTHALAPTFSAPPLLYLPNVPLFPRSANPVSSLPRPETMASTLHRTQLLRRLTRSDLSVSEEQSIASFASRRVSPTKSHFLLSKPDEGAASDVKRVSNVSRGLKRWISRPCFEDRMSVYTLGPSGQPDHIVIHNVVGSSLGVEALEVSATIEVLAGYSVEEQSETPWLPTLSSSSTADLQLPVPALTTASALNAQTRSQPYKANPSPLRIEAIPSSSDQTKMLKPVLSSPQSAPAPVLSSSTPSVNITPPPKRVRSSVRFDVEEKQVKDEHVPLGQVMRIKRGREERAKFLELEKGRRALEEERQRHEVEKRRWEQEKRAWEAERKAVEEEKKKRLYQQEVIAARKRRESQLFKGGLPSDLPELKPQSGRREGSYSRPAYDTPQRQSSDVSSSAASHPPLRNDSFNSLRGTSKPLSVHSAPLPSLDSSRTTSSVEGAAKTRDRRASTFPSTPPQVPMQMQPYGYPWGMPAIPQMPMQMQMQMIPQMPYHAMDNMPLLPPTAPFMMQRTSDRRQSSSSSPNRSSTSLGKSASQSTDRLPLNRGTSSTQRSSQHQRSSSGGSSQNLPGYGQQSSRGSFDSGQRASWVVNDPNQWRSSKSRPPMPQRNSQGFGSWVVPSPVAQRRHDTIS